MPAIVTAEAAEVRRVEDGLEKIAPAVSREGLGLFDEYNAVARQWRNKRTSFTNIVAETRPRVAAPYRIKVRYRAGAPLPPRSGFDPEGDMDG